MNWFFFGISNEPLDSSSVTILQNNAQIYAEVDRSTPSLFDWFSFTTPLFFTLLLSIKTGLTVQCTCMLACSRKLTFALVQSFFFWKLNGWRQERNETFAWTTLFWFYFCQKKNFTRTFSGNNSSFTIWSTVIFFVAPRSIIARFHLLLNWMGTR